MAKIDVVKSALAGFGVIGRNPMVIPIWAAFILVVGVLPAMLMLGGGIASILQLAAADAHGAEPTPEQVMPFFATFFVAMPILMIAGLLMRAVLTGAAFRAVLEPEKKSWGFMRLGMQELWLILVGIVLSFLLMAVYMVGLAPMAAMPLLAGDGGQFSPIMLFVPLWFLVVIGVMVFLLVRFSMAMPMSFAENRFRLFESWTLTRGNGWRIVLVALMLAAFMIAVEMVIWMLLVFVMLAVFGFNMAGQDEAAMEAKMEAFFSQDPSAILMGLAPWFIVGGLIAALLAAALVAVFTAPWAEAYRQLATPGSASEA